MNVRRPAVRPSALIAKINLTLPVRFPATSFPPVDTRLSLLRSGMRDRPITSTPSDNADRDSPKGATSPVNDSRLCVKGRYGWDYPMHPQRLRDAADPPRRRLPQGTAVRVKCKDSSKTGAASPAGMVDYRGGHAGVSRGQLGRGARPGRRRSCWAIKQQSGGDPRWPVSGSAKCSNEEAYLFQKLIRGGLRNEQRRSLHATVSRVERSPR